VNSAMTPGLAAVSVRWARVSDAIGATRARRNRGSVLRAVGRLNLVPKFPVAAVIAAAPSFKPDEIASAVLEAVLSP